MSFKIEPDRCPNCGTVVSGIIEVVPVYVQVEEQPNNTFDYSGLSDVWWDDQRPDEGPNHEQYAWCRECQETFPVHVKELPA